jgi:hypothetical protein
MNYYSYRCEPNASGAGSFRVDLKVPARVGDRIIIEGWRYEVLQVQHVISQRAFAVVGLNGWNQQETVLILSGGGR